MTWRDPAVDLTFNTTTGIAHKVLRKTCCCGHIVSSAIMSSFASFQQSFKGDLVTPTDHGYNDAIERWAHNAARRAKIVAFVKDASDVSLAVKYAKANSITIAIRGGGHSASGASSIEDGLVIDLSKYVDGVTVDAEKRLAHVGGGALWRTVDHTCIQYGLATVGGTVNHTGVGGLTLGGGYGWLSGRHGLVIDNLVQATVVVGDGSILTANASENSDLFYGIRGGGCNFGVVTEFVLQLHPQRRTVFGGLLYFTEDKLEQIATALDIWWPNAGESGALMCIPALIENTPWVLLQLFYNGSETEGKDHFKAFYDIGPFKADAADIPYEEMNSMNNVFAPLNLNYYMKGALLSEKPSQDLTREMFDRIIKFSQEDLNVGLVLEYLPHGKINSVPDDATPYRRNLHGHAVFLIQWKEHSPENQSLARDVSHNLAGLLSDGQCYGNYGSIDETSEKKTLDATQKLFGKHYPKLQDIKKKYDPDMLFRLWFPIVPSA